MITITQIMIERCG